MARKHYANAIISHQNVPFDEWMEVLRGQNEGAVPRDHVNRIAKTVLRKCDPNQYLLSHATIVASVDTFAPKGAKTGRLMNRGVQIDVRYPEYRIKPECLPIINNNGDAWDRSLLLSTYRTFIGAPNYCEHVQIPELSKGFIVDAIARDLGNSCYIDILVATDRKHNQLVHDILAGEMTALSMGCFVAGTRVTMADGSLLPIEEIRPEMHVLSQKGNVCRVNNLQVRSNRWSMRRVKASGLPAVEATDNHKFYAIPRQSLEYKKSYNRNLIVQKDYEWEYRESGDLRVGDILATPIPRTVIDPVISTDEARLLGSRHSDGVDQDVMNWPPSHQLAFMAGVIDSDGYVSKTKKGTTQVFISTRNETLANQYLTILARCGIVSTLTKTKRNGGKLLPNAAGTDYQIRLRNDGAVRIPSLKIEKVKDQIRYTPGNSDRWITDNYLYSRVKKIEKFDHSGFVYDLQVDNDHSYIANGYGVSNCISMFTICTKCGNVAADDSQLCPCIQYEGKHTEFTDESGKKQKIAELIGHSSVPNSNQFIEASWVKNPAFSGAVRRNFLNRDMIKLSSKMEESKAIYEIKRDTIELDGMKKAASTKRRADQDQGASLLDMMGGDEPAPDAPDAEAPESGAAQGAEAQGEEKETPGATPADKIDGLLDKVQEQLLTIIVEKLGDKLKPKIEDVGTAKPAVDLTSGNDNIIRSSTDFNRLVRQRFASTPALVKWAERTYKIVHEGDVGSIRAASLQPRDLIILSWIMDSVRGRRYASDLYNLAMKVGPLSNYPSEKSFLTACSLNFGRPLDTREKEFLVWKGKIASVGTLRP